MAYVYSVLCVVLCGIATTQAGYDLSYLVEDCNGDPDERVIYLGWNGASTYGVVQLMRYYEEYGTDYNCSLKLVPPAGYTMNIVVDRIDIYAKTPYGCSPDYLEVSNDVIKEQYCGTNTVDKVLTVDNYAIVRFVSGTTPHSGYNGFILYYNLFHTNNCSTNEHKCAKDNRCILRELTCDTRNNCGDYTDEYCSTPGWVIFLIVLSSLIALVIIVVVAAVCCCVGCCCVGCCCCSTSKKTTASPVDVVNTTASSEMPITTAYPSHLSPPPPYSEAAAITILDTKYNEKQQYDF